MRGCGGWRPPGDSHRAEPLHRDPHPEWAPDGRSIAFVRDNEEIRLAAPRGGGEERLAQIDGVGDLSRQAP